MRLREGRRPRLFRAEPARETNITHEDSTMPTDSLASLQRSLHRWKWLSLCLALALVTGLMLGQSDQPLPKASARQLQPVQVQPAQAQPAQPAQPRVAVRAPRQVLQPSDDVEATALAIAYDILREGGTDKLPASQIGGFAAEILNEFKSKRK